jgi:hypothetical protein
MRVARISALLAAITVAGAVVQPAPSTPARPALTVRSLAPFTVRGSYFQPFERVTVTLSGTWIRHRTATAEGAFVARFRGVDIDPCNGFRVKAAGSKGSVAVLHPPPRMCASMNPG